MIKINKTELAAAVKKLILKKICNITLKKYLKRQ